MQSTQTTKASDAAGAFISRVLIVDDDELPRRVLMRLLARDKHLVTAVASGSDALQAVEDAAPNLILLGSMPDLTAIETLSELRGRHSASALPIIILASQDAADSIAHYLDAGANDYVVKPIRWALLRARVASHLTSQRAHAELRRAPERLEAAASAR